MSDLSEMIDRNRQFASQYSNNLTILPRFSTMILTCVDARIDPAYFLGLKPGDAAIFRNTGGRVTEAVELEIGILWTLASKLSNGAIPGLSLAIMHHTDCGFERLANPSLGAALSHKLGVDKAQIDALAIVDHKQSLHDDIERLRRSSLVPDELVVSGHLYNLEDGLVQEVVAPAPLAAFASMDG